MADQGGDCEVKQCNVAIKFCEIPEHLWYGKARMRMRRMKMNKSAIQLKAKLPAGYVMTPEEERSMHHMELGTMCKCGHKETRVRHLKHT